MKPAEEAGMRIWRGHVQMEDVKDETDLKLLQSLLPNGYAPFMIRDGLTYLFVFNHHEIIPGLLLYQIGTPLENDKDLEAIFQAGVSSEEQRAIWQALLRQTREIQYTRLCTINMDDISEQEEEDVTKCGRPQGWGGSRRITLIGDAAHACRPTDGQGANMAFEDACVLVRKLEQFYLQSENTTLDDIGDLVLDFENTRRPRVKRIHRDQAERALKQGKDWTRWSAEFMDWVYKGV